MERFEKSYHIFEQDGRIRQPMIELFRSNFYLFDDPGVNSQFFLHREFVDGTAKYFLVRVVKSFYRLTKGKRPIFYYPIHRLEVIHDYPGFVGKVPWDVIFLKIYRDPRPEDQQIALLRVMPKDEKSPYNLRTREGVVCRYMDEDNDPLNLVSWVRKRVETEPPA